MMDSGPGVSSGKVTVAKWPKAPGTIQVIISSNLICHPKKSQLETFRFSRTSPPNPVIIYKIKKGDMFSTGGSVPFFSKAGKSWSSKTALHSHLRLFAERKSKIYDGCQLIRYEIVEAEVCSVADELLKMTKEKEAREIKKRALTDSREFRQDIKTIQELKEKHGLKEA